jgi:hypothetical protein
MNIYDEFLQHSAELAADMKQPPFPVVCQFGIYAFEVDGRYPAAVTVSGVGAGVRPRLQGVGRAGAA